MQRLDRIVPVKQETPGGERAARVRERPEVFKEFRRHDSYHVTESVSRSRSRGKKEKP
jgi:hypothetical protein